MILSDLARALGQFDDPRFRRVLWRGIALALVLLAVAAAAVLWLVGWLTPDAATLPGVGEVGWFGDALGWGTLALMLVLSAFLMIPVASAMTSFFLDEVADAVEARHYPDLPPAPHAPFGEALRDGAGFLGVLILANLLALVLYLLFPFLIPVIFYGLNGFLLGREYFQVAAMRREGRTGASALRARHRGQIWLAGCLMAVPLSIPVVNLLVPIVGAATFTHLYHRLARR